MNILLPMLIWVALLLFFLAGLAGSIIPSVPGPPLIFAGSLIYAMATRFERVGWFTLLILGIIAALAQIVDYLAAVYGVRKLGGSKWGMWGSVLGGLIGLLIGNIPGMIVGLFAGAFLMELWKGNKDLLSCTRVGWGSLLGFLGGTLIKVIFSLIMIGIFLADVFRPMNLLE